MESFLSFLSNLCCMYMEPSWVFLYAATGRDTVSELTPAMIFFKKELLLVWEVKVSATQSYPTLCDPMDCSPRGSSVHGILQARILEWVAIPFSRGSFWLDTQFRGLFLQTNFMCQVLRNYNIKMSFCPHEAYQLLNKRGTDTPYSPGSYNGLFGNVIHNFYQVKLSLLSMA